MISEVKVLREYTLHDIPKHLRALADEIESGEYGLPVTCAVVLFANELSVFGYGEDSSGPTVHVTLMAGAHKLQAALVNQHLTKQKP